MKKHWPIIHIIGLPGAGKTTLGKRLSKQLGLPVFYIGTYRARYPKTAIGEVDAWVALFRALSRRRWQDCILETTGLNFREEFLWKALPFGKMMTVKLEASRKMLHKRIRMKKKSEQGGNWLFSKDMPDKVAFVDRLYKKFDLIPADIVINTERLTKAQVYSLAWKKIPGLELL
ncbi:MAG: hypothetical protein HQL20_08490 [Candidatus Omnitrophica bacterium]|nr:hypothetical protein [Candidatus Omnitrophota bacterium]